MDGYVGISITLTVNRNGLIGIVLFHRLNATEQRELQSRMEKKQMKEFMTVCIHCYSGHAFATRVNRGSSS